jgi:hypothetical protein
VDEGQRLSNEKELPNKVLEDGTWQITKKYYSATLLGIEIEFIETCYKIQVI